jgi:negative regulator of genetic competence, sporulation and motility
MGIERLREALEANEWESNELGEQINLEDLEYDDEGEDEGGIGFGIEAAEMEMEMFGMKQAIHGSSNAEENDDEEGQDEGVEQLQAMMLRMQAVRGKFCSNMFRCQLTAQDMGADMPEAERKRFAARAVNEIMKKL